MNANVITPPTPTNLRDFLPEARAAVEELLLRHLPLSAIGDNSRLNEAIYSAVFPGGKRLRPVLALLGAQVVVGNYERALPAAAAVEFIHTSSLIFDDLPCMDDAPLRRGRPALHLLHGEGPAVLAAVALMSAAFQLLLSGYASDRRLALRAHAELFDSVGANGMIGGQAIDLDLRRRPETRRACLPPASTLNLKTSALIRCALRLGALSCGADERQLAALSRFADLIGDAYQLSDDLADEHEDAARRQCASPADLPRREDVRREVESLIAEAGSVVITQFGPCAPALMLCQVTQYIDSTCG